MLFFICEVIASTSSHSYSKSRERRHWKDILSWLRNRNRNKDKPSIKQWQEDKEFSVSAHIFNVEAIIWQKFFSYFIKFSEQTSITEVIESEICKWTLKRMLLMKIRPQILPHTFLFLYVQSLYSHDSCIYFYLSLYYF